MPLKADALAETGQVVHIVPPSAEDARIVESIAAGAFSGRAQLFDRFAPHVRGVLVRLLGLDPDLDDLIQDVFLEAIRSLPRLRDPDSLQAFLTQIAVHAARGRIRKRVRNRWLSFGSPEDFPQPIARDADETVREALVTTYRVLDAMPTDERVAFTLRYLEGMELVEVADACSVSLATIKRRILRAERMFVAKAKSSVVLRDWLEGGLRWSTK
jgi:RNA polymerase sigma-70 factor, ECF subfamily